MGLKYQPSGPGAHKQKAIGEHCALSVDRTGPTAARRAGQLVYCCRP